jgi:hypothetical protein
MYMVVSGTCCVWTVIAEIFNGKAFSYIKLITLDGHLVLIFVELTV